MARGLQRTNGVPKLGAATTMPQKNISSLEYINFSVALKRSNNHYGTILHKYKHLALLDS